MVAVMEVSEKDIETLREAIDGCGGSSYTQALAILDRLTPAPEPEVDEATVWARKVIIAWAFKGRLEKDDLYLDAAQLNAARAVIADLIASKDGEIERWKDEATRQRKLRHQAHDMAVRRLEELEKAESELATLRAENERLRDACGRIAAMNDLSDVPDADLESYARGNLYECETIARSAIEAAERNPAEPATETTSIYDPNYKCPVCGVAIGALHEPDCALMLSRLAETATPHGPGPWPGDPDHRETMAASETSPGTNAGAVEVAELDRKPEGESWRGVPIMAYYWEEPTDFPPPSSQTLARTVFHWSTGPSHAERLVKLSDTARLCTEAEARGRRDALEEMRVWTDKCDIWIRRVDLISAVQRMMTGEK